MTRITSRTGGNGERGAGSRADAQDTPRRSLLACVQAATSFISYLYMAIYEQEPSRPARGWCDAPVIAPGSAGREWRRPSPRSPALRKVLPHFGAPCFWPGYGRLRADSLYPFDLPRVEDDRPGSAASVASESRSCRADGPVMGGFRGRRRRGYVEILQIGCCFRPWAGV